MDVKFSISLSFDFILISCDCFVLSSWMTHKNPEIFEIYKYNFTIRNIFWGFFEFVHDLRYSLLSPLRLLVPWIGWNYILNVGQTDKTT